MNLKSFVTVSAALLFPALIVGAAPTSEPSGKSDRPTLNDPDSLAIERAFDAAVVKAKAEYDPAMATALTNAIAKLKARMEVLTRAGNLDAAVADRELISDLAEKMQPATTEPATTTSNKEQCISQQAKYTASSQEAEYPPLPSLLTGEGKLHLNTFAFHTKDELGPHIVIDLGQPQLVAHIVIQNRLDGFFDQASGLTMWFGMPTQKVKVWAADSPAASWDFRIAPTRTRYVTIGLPEPVRGHFHLAYVKIYGPVLKDPESLAIERAYEAAEAKAKADYDRVVANARKNASAKLKVRIAQLTRAGNLDDALADQSFIGFLANQVPSETTDNSISDKPFLPIEKVIGTWAETNGAKYVFTRDGKFMFAGDQPGSWHLTTTNLILTWKNTGRVDTYDTIDPADPNLIHGDSPVVGHRVQISRVNQ